MNQPDIPPVLQESKPDKRFWGVLIRVAMGVLAELGVYLLMRGNQEWFGAVVFILVPFIAGFCIAIFTPDGTRLVRSLVGTLLLTLSILIFIGLEGYICCFMAAPLLFGAVGLGIRMGMGFKGRFISGKKNSSATKTLLLLSASFLLVGARSLEEPFIEKPRFETFEQRATIPASSEKAWGLIKAMNRLEAQKPLLLKLGLPVPQSCEVDKEAVGGKRICHFNLCLGSGAAASTEWWPLGWRQRSTLVWGGCSRRRRWVPLGPRPSLPILITVRTLHT